MKRTDVIRMLVSEGYSIREASELIDQFFPHKKFTCEVQVGVYNATLTFITGDSINVIAEEII